MASAWMEHFSNPLPVKTKVILKGAEVMKHCWG